MGRADYRGCKRGREWEAGSGGRMRPPGASAKWWGVAKLVGRGKRSVIPGAYIDAMLPLGEVEWGARPSQNAAHMVFLLRCLLVLVPLAAAVDSISTGLTMPRPPAPAILFIQSLGLWALLGLMALVPALISGRLLKRRPAAGGAGGADGASGAVERWPFFGGWQFRSWRTCAWTPTRVWGAICPAFWRRVPWRRPWAWPSSAWHSCVGSRRAWLVWLRVPWDPSSPRPPSSPERSCPWGRSSRRGPGGVARGCPPWSGKRQPQGSPTSSCWSGTRRARGTSHPTGHHGGRRRAWRSWLPIAWSLKRHAPFPASR